MSTGARTSLGVDAVEVARRSGTTTFVDAGSAGPGIFHGFRRHVIEPSPLRIIPYLNVSFPGIFALSAAVAVGECADLRLLDPRQCVRVIEANRDLIAGVKVRVGRNAGGASGVAPSTLRSRSQKRPGYQSWRISTTRRRAGSRYSPACAVEIS